MKDVKVHYRIFLIKNGVNSGGRDSCIEEHKIIPMLYNQWAKVFKSVFQHVYTALNIMKVT